MADAYRSSACPVTVAAQMTREADEGIRVTRAIGKRQIPELETGTARIVVTAVRPVLFGYREIQSTAARDVEVRLTPPRIAVQSTHHYINHGGSEMVVYRVTPADAVSGVRVGDHEYLGFPASGAGLENGDPALRMAFFALLWDQDLTTPIDIFARDELGNESHATFDYRVFPKVFRNSLIEIDDRFLSKVSARDPAKYARATRRESSRSAHLVPAHQSRFAARE